MRVLITGAAGFVGGKLVSALAAEPTIKLSGKGAGGVRVDEIVAHDLVPPPVPEIPAGGPTVVPVSGDLTNEAEIDKIFGKGVDLVVHLAAVVSGGAEEDFDLGYRVNLDGTRSLLEACRRLGTCPVFLFASSTAAYGGELPAVVPDDLRLRPTTSYGTQKVIGELLVSDYSRKGYLDGRAFRFPTVAVRPGAPNKALSSFVSSIVREPLSGLSADCPVADDIPVFITSPRMLLRNILHGAGVPAEELGQDRAMTFPGLRVTVGEIIEAVRDIAGESVASRIIRKPDPVVAKVVMGWPGYVASERARSLGFVSDGTIHDVINAHIEDELGGESGIAR